LLFFPIFLFLFNSHSSHTYYYSFLPKIKIN
jgi:hypothetical protein